MRKKAIFIIVLLLITFSFLSLGSNSKQENINNVSVTSIINNTFSYRGEENTDALKLLKEKTSIEQDNSGLVTSINGREANTEDREYWAFYINRKMAAVGPADYITQDTDLIEWKIEKY